MINISRNKSNLHHQMMRHLDALASKGIGKSKREEKLKNLHAGKGYKSEYIHSVRTLELYKNEATQFCNWLKDNHYHFKSIGEVPRFVAADYIKSRNSLSAWTSHLTMAAVNKITGFQFSSKELGLKNRRIQDIRNNRGFAMKTRPSLETKYAKEINFICNVGVRRASMGKINFHSFVFNSSHEIEAVKTIEKGGRHNCYYVLPQYREELSHLVSDFYSNHQKDVPIFAGFDPRQHINCHWYRNQYSCLLYQHLENNISLGLPYFGDSGYPSYAINWKKVEANIKRHGEFYKTYRTETLALVSQALGHYRLDVCINHYLRFDCL